MPVVAVAAGAFAVGEIATVGIAAMSTFEVIAAVGAITSGIGALTGNEDLMKIGAVAGLAGGVGAFAQGKGWLATGDAANTASGAAGTGNIKAMTQTVAPGVENTLNNPSAWTAGSEGQTAGLSSGSIATNLTTPMKEPGLIGSGTSDLGLGSIADSKIVGSPLTASPGAASAPLPTGQGGWQASLGTTTLGSTARNMSYAGAQPGGGVLGMLKDFGNFLKDNKELASMAGNFIGGMFDDEKKAKADYYQAGADSLRAKTANGSAVPNMGFTTKQNGPFFKPTSPTYTGVSLWNAR